MGKRNDYIKKWRKSEAGIKSIEKARLKSAEKRKKWAKEYYLANKDKILKSTTEYSKNNPQVAKKTQEKNRDKNINRARKDRQDLKPHYINTLIRIQGVKDSIESRQSQVLIKRIKKEINNLGETRVCSDCLDNLPNSSFNRRGKTQAGETRYNNFCKKCYSIRRKKYKLDRYKAKAASQKYYLKKRKLKNEQHNHS